MNRDCQVILASASPRRRQLLAQLGVRFEALDAGLDESLRHGESPAAYAERLAREKAQAGWEQSGRGAPSLGADTIVVLDGDILLKPDSHAAAAAMLQRLSGRDHVVISAVAVISERGLQSRVNRTRVRFAAMPAAWIEKYAAGEEPMDKAGAYAVQGAAARWIEHIDGSFSGVMGLPLYETAQLLSSAGVLR